MPDLEDIKRTLEAWLGLPADLAYKVGEWIVKQFVPEKWVETAKRYGTEAAPVPPPGIIVTSAINPASQAVGYLEFILEEAMQMTSFSLMGLMRLREYEAADLLLDQLSLLWKYGMTVHESIGKMNPTTYVAYGLNYKAVAAMILGYRYMIAKYRDPKWIARYEEVRDWYEDMKKEIKEAQDEELEPLEKALAKRKRELVALRSAKLKELMDLRRKKKISYEEWLKRRSEVYEWYYAERDKAYEKYRKLKEAIKAKYDERYDELRKRYYAKLNELNVELLEELIREDPEIYNSVSASLGDLAIKFKGIEIPRIAEVVPEWLVEDLAKLFHEGKISEADFNSIMERLKAGPKAGEMIFLKGLKIAWERLGKWEYVSKVAFESHFWPPPKTVPAKPPEVKRCPFGARVYHYSGSSPPPSYIISHFEKLGYEHVRTFTKEYKGKTVYYAEFRCRG